MHVKGHFQPPLVKMQECNLCVPNKLGSNGSLKVCFIYMHMGVEGHTATLENAPHSLNKEKMLLGLGLDLTCHL